MRPTGIALLRAFRDDLWANADELTTGMIPLESFLPDSVMENILDGLPYLLSKQTIESLRLEDGSFDLKASATLLRPFVTDNIHLIGESSRILETILRIHSEFDRIREEKKMAAKEKRETLKSGVDKSGVDIPADSASTSESSSEEDEGKEATVQDPNASRTLRVDLQ